MGGDKTVIQDKAVWIGSTPVKRTVCFPAIETRLALSTQTACVLPLPTRTEVEAEVKT